MCVEARVLFSLKANDNAISRYQAKEAVDVAELRRWVDTRELMRRDRENHRLKLDRLDELPTNVMKQVNRIVAGT